MTIAPTKNESDLRDIDAAELLIKEARLTARRRRLKTGAAFLSVFAVVVTLLMAAGLASIHRGVPAATSSGKTLSTGATSSSPGYIAPPLLCAANGMAMTGNDLWISGCVFNDSSGAVTRTPAIVELNSTTGSLIRVLRDRDAGNDGPQGLATSDSRVWVANGDGNSVAELNAKNGTLIRVIKSKNDRFNSPWSIVADSAHIWISDAGNSTITELNAANGSLVRVLPATREGFISTDGGEDLGSHLWLAGENSRHGQVFEFNNSTGALEKAMGAKADDFNSPSAVAINDSNLWVTSQVGPVSPTPLADGEANLPGGSVTELNASNGKLVRVINAKADDFYGSSGIAVDHSHVWVANSAGNSVTELNASNGNLVRVIKAKTDRLGGPNQVIVMGSHVWILDSAVLVKPEFDVWGGGLTELNAADGSLVRVIR